MGALTGIDLDVTVAFNNVERDVQVNVLNGSDLESTSGTIDVSASRDIEVRGDAKASALSNGSFPGGSSLSISGGGTFSQNAVIGDVLATVDKSTLTTNTAGNVSVTATDSAVIDATAHADSAVVLDALDTSLSSSGSSAGSLGVSVALNTVGYEIGAAGLFGSLLDGFIRRYSN